MCEDKNCSCKKEQDSFKCPNCGNKIDVSVGREAKGEEVNGERTMNLLD